MKLSVCYFTLFSLATGLLYGAFEGKFHEKLLKIGWSRCLSELDQYSAAEQRIILEKALLAFSGDIPPRELERQRNFEVAKSAMLTIPGHAKYYQDKIEKTRALVKENESLTADEKIRLEREGKWVGSGNYESVRLDAFKVLGHLPSSETVAVLGHFLEDPEGRDRKNMFGSPINEATDVLPLDPNCRMAYNAISHLGIEHPPTKASDSKAWAWDFNLEPIDAWKDWWNEVKAGKRTYRFIGSTIEYGPDGPVKSGKGSRGTKSDQKTVHPEVSSPK